MCRTVLAGLLLAAANNAALAQAQPASQVPAGSAVPVTVDNLNPAESDLVMGSTAASASTCTTASYTRSTHPFVRPNRDTLYSFANFDLDDGPVTITPPNADQRFMSLQVIDEYQYAPDSVPPR